MSQRLFAKMRIPLLGGGAGSLSGETYWTAAITPRVWTWEVPYVPVTLTV